MSEAINNISTKQINDEYNLEATTASKGTKAMEQGGITSISYTDKDGNNFVVQGTKDDLFAFLLTQDPEAVEKMVTELSTGMSPEALKSMAKEGMDVVKGMTALVQNDTTVNTNTTDISRLVSNGSFNSFDIRELMKLLINAFAQFFATQRELDLNTITQIQAAMETKIAAMEKEKDESYKAAMAQAIGSIVSGAISVGAGCISIMASAGGMLGSAGGSASKLFGTAGNTGAVSKGLKVVNMLSSILEKASALTGKVGETIGNTGKIAEGGAGIASAVFTSRAKDQQIIQTQQDAVLEILKKMQSDGSEQTKQLMDFISRLLSMIQELQQNAAQTEKTIVQA